MGGGLGPTITVELQSGPAASTTTAAFCLARLSEGAGALALEALHRQVHTVLGLLLVPCVTGPALLLSHRPHALLSVSTLL